MRKRVIFISDTFSAKCTGPGTFANILWNEFRNDPELDFHVVTSGAQYDDRRIHLVSSSPIPGRLYNNLQELAARLVVNGQTLVHANAPHLANKMIKLGVPTVVQVNDYEGAEIWGNFGGVVKRQGLRRALALVWRRRKETQVFARATDLIFNSYACQRINAAAFNIPRDVGRVIYKSAELHCFTRPAKRSFADEFALSQHRFLFVGSNWQIKGLPNLLEALIILQSRGLNITLDVIGSTASPWNQRIIDEVRRGPLRDVVQFTGVLSSQQIATFMWNSDFFVLPSRSEALGVAVIEAMAASMVVFGASVGGIPEIIEHRQSGYLLGSTSPKQMAEDILEVVSDPDLQQIMRQSAPLRAAKFAPESMVHAIRGVYNQYLN